MEMNGIDVTEQEKTLLLEAEKLKRQEESGTRVFTIPEEETERQEENDAQPATDPGRKLEDIAYRHKAYGEKVYRVTVTVMDEDDAETDHTYLFTRPRTQSYDRYVQSMSKSITKASRVFTLDNVVEEQREELRADLEEYPAMAVNISGKLLAMLGLGDDVSVKKL